MKIITIHAKNAIDFLNNNGIGVLTDFSSSPKIKESLNGELYLEFEYISNGKYSKYLVEENIIVSPIGYGERQAFRIEKTKKVIDDSNIYIYVFAKHISYDLDDNIIEDSFVQDKDADTALSWILSHTQYEHNFKGSSDIPKRNSARYIFKNPIQAILSDDENSFVNRWGGEIVRDNFNIKMLQARGIDKGVNIRYRKNLKGITFETDYSNIATRIKPKGYDGLELSEAEKYVDSLLINNYVNPKITEREYSDIKLKENPEDEEGFDTLDECYTELRKRAREEFENGIDKPIISAIVNFVELSKTTEYEEYKNLEKLCIGDTVHIYIDEFDLEVTEKVISTVYDPVSEKYTSFELGKPFSSYTLETKKFEKKLEETIIPSYMDVAIQNATNLLTTALGGFVVKTRNELFILDNEDINEAKKVWRWNLNGLGYSKNGIEGPFETAITQDGQIVADFITAGTMSIDRIEGLSNTLKEFSRIILEHDKLSLLVSNTIDITKEMKEKTNCLELQNCMEGNLKELEIYGDNEVFNNSSKVIVHSENLKHKFEKKLGYRALTVTIDYDENYNITRYKGYSSKHSNNNRYYILSLEEGKTYHIILDKNEFNKTKWVYLETFENDPFESESESNIMAESYYGAFECKRDLETDSWSWNIDIENNYITITPTEKEKYLIFYCYTASTFETAKIYENYQEIELKINEPLRQLPEIHIDTETNEEKIDFIKDKICYKNNILTLIRKIGIDDAGHLYKLENEIVKYLDENLIINLLENTNYIEIVDYSADIYAKYIMQNEYTKIFTSPIIEMNSSIEMLKNQIKLMVTQGNLISYINMLPDLIDIQGDRIRIKSKYFELTPDGEITAIRGKIGGLTLNSNSLYKTFTMNNIEYESGFNIPDKITEGVYQAFIYAGKPVGEGYYKSNMYMTHTGRIFFKNGYLSMMYEPDESNGGVRLRTALDFSEYGINRFLKNGNRWTYEGVGFVNGNPHVHSLFLYDALGYQIINGAGDSILFSLERDSKNATYYGKLYMDGGYPAIRSVTTDSQEIVQMRHAVSYVEYIVNNGYGAFGISGIFQSDTKLKDNIEDTKVNALDIIKKLKHIQFDWKENKMAMGKGHEEISYSANQIQEDIGMNIVYEVKQPAGSEFDSILQINDSRLIPIVTKAIQEIDEHYNEKISTLENRILKIEGGVKE